MRAGGAEGWQHGEMGMGAKMGLRRPMARQQLRSLRSRGGQLAR